MSEEASFEAHESIWAAGRDVTPHPALDRDISVDVAVVGGGITGVTTALLLKREGLRVALLEARHLASGVTGGTSGHLTQVLDTRFHELERTFGRDGAILAARSGLVAIEQIEALARLLVPSCHFERVPGFLFAETPAQVAKLNAERDACARLGIPAVEDTPALPFPIQGALRFDGQARVHPVRYVVGLAQHVPGDGSHVFENTRVVAVDDGAPCRVHTAAGPDVTARHVVLATHSPLTRVVLQTKIASYRSYVVSGPCPADLDGLFWDLADPYHYVRSFSVNDVPHLLVGGADHKTGKDPDGEEPFVHLRSYAGRFGLERITHTWSSQVIEPIDGLPFIGKNAHSDHVFVATGYSGNGITFGTLAALLIRDAIAGRNNELAELYSPGRFKASSVPTYLGENVDFPFHLVTDVLHPVDVASPDDIPRGSGAITRIDGQRLAVFRDDSGNLHAVSPICTHMGCHVKFNPREASWDCPCHGSRFTRDGEVIDGPAVKGLKQKKLVDRP